ncbi:hypothetical protein LWI29_027392 [Acer saccharum]|uniref:NAC domain-containing protein n=1 Tax=Acer saccharum TaxID=4024 RepID=A0AA39SRA8_ACESA|nr:hypothetical protein LWI29_027392 [Acer saccharum]
MADEEQREQLKADLMGYRFLPTEEEIVSYFLAEKLRGHDNKVRTIEVVDINKFEPWELPHDADEPSPLPLSSNSGNCLNGNIVPQEKNELPSDLQSFLDNNEPDNSSLSSVQFQRPTAEGPSCSNGSINVLDVVRSQLDTREQDDDFFDSWLATGEDQHLHEENLQTSLHDFHPMNTLAGYTESNLPVEQSGSSRDGPIVVKCKFRRTSAGSAPSTSEERETSAPSTSGERTAARLVCFHIQRTGNLARDISIQEPEARAPSTFRKRAGSKQAPSTFEDRETSAPSTSGERTAAWPSGFHIQRRRAISIRELEARAPSTFRKRAGSMQAPSTFEDRETSAPSTSGERTAARPSSFHIQRRRAISIREPEARAPSTFRKPARSKQAPSTFEDRETSAPSTSGERTAARLSGFHIQRRRAISIRELEARAPSTFRKRAGSKQAAFTSGEQAATGCKRRLRYILCFFGSFWNWGRNKKAQEK